MDRISELLYKQFNGTITEKERHELQAWRDICPENEELASRICDNRWLTGEFRMRSLIDTGRPCGEMERHIRNIRHPLRLQIIASAAASILIMACVALFLLIQQEPHVTQSYNNTAVITSIDSIKAGTQGAVLHYAAGGSVHLRAADTLSQLTAPIVGNRTTETLKTRELCLEVPRGHEFKIVLEDSTEVWLNSDSRLIYPETFGKDERRVEVVGEAYFAVHKEEKRPFYVVTGQQQIRVYGTTFNVRNYSDDDLAYTTLESGSIALSHLGAGGEVILKPGHQAVFDKDEENISMKLVNPEVITGWRRGRFVFEEQPLGNIMRDLSRWYNFEYEFTDPALANIVILGSIPRYSDFTTAITILENCGGIRFEVRDGNRVTIVKKL